MYRPFNKTRLMDPVSCMACHTLLGDLRQALKRFCQVAVNSHFLCCAGKATSGMMHFRADLLHGLWHKRGHVRGVVRGQ